MPKADQSSSSEALNSQVSTTPKRARRLQKSLRSPPAGLPQPRRASEAVGAGQGAGLRRLVGVQQTPAKPVMPAPPGPGTPGSLRTVQGEEGSVYGAPAAGAARGSIAPAPGQLTSNFPPTTELASSSSPRQALAERRPSPLPLSFPSFQIFPGPPMMGRVFGSRSGRRRSPAQPVPPTSWRPPSSSMPGATWLVSSWRSSGLCPYVCRGQDTGCQPAESRSRPRLRRPVASCA